VAFVVVYDASVLYPNVLRDLLVRIAQARLVQAKWTDQILDEVFGSLTKNRPDLDPKRLARTRKLMNEAVADCLVTGYQPLIGSVELPDPDDRHVVAAAIRAQAQTIVTHNLRDFPETVLRQWDIEAQAPDQFILDQIDLDRQAVYGAVQRIADSGRNPPRTVNDVLNSLERSGIVAATAALRTLR
jgi:predicted nucleic acid-binding protein